MGQKYNYPGPAEVHQKIELISPEGIRLDGRKADEMRPITAKVGVLKKCDGSGYFAKKTMVELKNDLFPYVLAAVLALFFVELFYYKRRELL